MDIAIKEEIVDVDCAAEEIVDVSLDSNDDDFEPELKQEPTDSWYIKQENPVPSLTDAHEEPREYNRTSINENSAASEDQSQGVALKQEGTNSAKEGASLSVVVAGRILRSHKKRYCYVCHNYFQSEVELVNHLRRKHGIPQCIVCLKHFRTEPKLKKHQLHKHSRNFPTRLILPGPNPPQNDSKPVSNLCIEPNISVHSWLQKFYNLSSEPEVKLVIPNAPFIYPCDICKIKFQTKFNLFQHYNMHIMEETYATCSICRCKFTTPEELEAHKITHLDEVPYLVCSFCQKRFITENQLEKHLKTTCFEGRWQVEKRLFGRS